MLPNDETLYHVLKNKVIDYVEIVVLFTENCNMSCVFCPQDHDSMLGATPEEILSKAQLVQDFVNRHPKKDFVVHAMGGELFQDKFIDQGFLEVYQEFMSRIRSGIAGDKTIEFMFVTNLVYQQIDAVIGFCQDNDLKMNVSYDPTGRFTARQLELFKANIEKFADYIHLISTVITLPNIQKIQQGDDYFDYLYSRFECDWDQLLPAGTNENLMPKSSDLLAYYQHMIDHYPNCNNIQYFTDRTRPRQMACTRGSNHTILMDGTSPKGCSGTVLLQGGNSNREELGTPKIIRIFLEKNECMTCEYFSNCSFTCFIKNDYKRLVDDLDECVFKKAFRYADDKDRS